jgi:hypothetical protein
MQPTKTVRNVPGNFSEAGVPFSGQSATEGYVAKVAQTIKLEKSVLGKVDTSLVQSW